jgi:hypothetical protein
MSKGNEIKFGECFNLPNPGLRSYLDNVVKGQPEEYRTTFAKGSSLSKVLADWKPTIDRIGDQWPTLLDFENDLAKKVGPLSIQKPLDERMDDIDHYYTMIKDPGEPISDKAISATLAEWGSLRGLLLRDQKRTVENMKLSTNSGSPYFAKRRAVVDKTLPVRIETEGLSSRMFLNDREWTPCAVLGWRGQEGGPNDEDVKQRVVWMFPFGVNVQELRVYQPLIMAAQRQELVPAWVGLESVDRRITRLFDTKGEKDLVVCTDFSKFDQHFNLNLQNAAKSILTQLLTPNAESRSWLENVFPVKYMIPLLYAWGEIRTGYHGMGSGSGGTNADETLAHRSLQYEAAIANNQRLNPNSQCLGDDGILTYPGITAEDVMRSYTAHGLEMNPDKQYVSTQDCTYLRRWHHQHYRQDGVCVGVYSTYRALGRLCEQERYYDPEVWGPKMVALRQLSIIENCKYHPLKEEFVQFCMKRDKFRLGLDIPGFLDNIEKEAMKATDYMPDFLGYTKSLEFENRARKSPAAGISQWWVVNYLKSLK